MTEQYTVYMHPDLVDELDEGFSPTDGLVAINDLFTGLPLQHRSNESKRKRWRAPKRLRVYRGRFTWYRKLGFSYVEIGTQLHVIELWFDSQPERHSVDIILEERELAEANRDEVLQIHAKYLKDVSDAVDDGL